MLSVLCSQCWMRSSCQSFWSFKISPCLPVHIQAVKTLGLKEIEAVIYAEDELIPDEEIAFTKTLTAWYAPGRRGSNFKKLLKQGKRFDELSKPLTAHPPHLSNVLLYRSLLDNMKEFFKKGHKHITKLQDRMFAYWSARKIFTIYLKRYMVRRYVTDYAIRKIC